MKGPLRWASVAIGLLLIGAGVTVSILGVDSLPVALGLIGLTVLGVLVVGAIRLYRGPPRTEAGALPWSGVDGFATPAPERTDSSVPLSSDTLALHLHEAGATARSERDIEAGLADIRPMLRETLAAVLELEGRSPGEVTAAIDRGEWTDDGTASWVLSPTLAEPAESLRERIRRWLFPERIVRDRTHRAVAAIVSRADASVPPVPGQAAPRTVPVVDPRLEELRRGSDSTLTRAVDPDSRRGGESP